MVDYDIVIVGTGASSSSFLHEYSKLHPFHKIAVIEKGSDSEMHIPEFEFNNIRHQQKWLRTGKGGTTQAWHGHLVELTELDFNLGAFKDDSRVSGAALDNWCVGYDTFTRYYPKAYKFLKAPAINASKFESQIAEKLRGHNINTEYLATSEVDGKPTNLYGLLSTKNQITEYFDTQVIKVRHKNGKVTGVQCLDNRTGAKFNLHSKIVILGCSPVESIKLFLLSGLSKNGLVGRKITFLTDMYVRAIVDIERLPQKRNIFTLSYMDEYESSTATTIKSGKYGFSDRLFFKGEEQRKEEIAKSNFTLDRLNQEKKKYVVQINFKGEAMPLMENRVTLSRFVNSSGVPIPAISYKQHIHDNALRKRAFKKMLFFLEKLGYDQDTLEYRVDAGNYLSTHVHGGLQFGPDDTTGVLDPNCMSYNCEGLFVIDASFMPTSSGANATLSLVANAIRVASKM